MEPALFRLTPALDIILTRPSDPAHSEYAGLCMQLHHLLSETILTTKVGKNQGSRPSETVTGSLGEERNFEMAKQ